MSNIPIPNITDLELGSQKIDGLTRSLQGEAGYELTRTSESHSFTPEGGWMMEETYTGPAEILLTEAKKRIKEYKEDDYRVSVDVSSNGDGFGTLRLKVPSRLGDEKEFEDEDTITWSLTGNDMEKDILTHPHLVDASEADFDILRKLKSDPTMSPPNIMDFTGIPTQKPYDISILIRMGVMTYSVSQWVLRRSAVLHSESTTQAALDDVGKQFTKAQLESFEGMPSNLKFTLPATGVWIKRTPSVGLDGSRYTIDGEYWHPDYASTILYPQKS